MRAHDRHFSRPGRSTGIQVQIRPAVRLQQIKGLGAAFTDTSLWLLSKLPDRRRRPLLRQLFGGGPSGLGLSVMRLPMGSSDFTASGIYSYDDRPAGDADPRLAHFSIRHDRGYVLPILREALHVNRGLRLLASPWSPPAWMKTNGSMLGVSPSGERGTLRDDAYGPFARYFVKFLQAYRTAGVPIWAVTPQNEPDHTSDYPGLALSAADQVRFVTRYMRPALRRARIRVRVYGHDTNWYSSSLFGLAGSSRARRDLDGLAFHCYLGRPAEMTLVHKLYPRLDLIEDECSAPQASAIDVAIRSVSNRASVVLTWNLALDPAGGPKIGHGCETCTGLLTIDPESSRVRYDHDLWELAHISAFVSRGARRIAAFARHRASYCHDAGHCGVEWAAFRNPDGRVAFVAASHARRPIAITLKRSDNTRLRYVVPAAGVREPAVVTITWR
jgi:glucosylceramidase